MALSGARFVRSAIALGLLLGSGFTLAGCEDRAQASIAKGNAQARSGKLAQAASTYEQATREDASSSKAWELWGNALYELGRLDDAQKAYEGALLRAPASVDARIGLARIEAQHGRRDEALISLASVLKDAPDNVLALTVHASLCLARGAQADTDAALSDTEHALRQKPQDPSALYVRGNALIASKQFDDARRAFEALGKVSPSSPLSDYGLARLSAAEADRTGALTELSRALEKAKPPKSGENAPALLSKDAVRADPAFKFLEGDPAFSQLVSLSP